jgi:8-amino-7-oxononanoate synthase
MSEESKEDVIINREMFMPTASLENNLTLSSISESYYQFSNYPEYIQTTLQKKIFAKANIELPYFRQLNGIATAETMISGKKCINFASYNYLNLSGHPRVNEAAKKAIDEYGTSVAASRIVSGEIPLHKALENAIANLLNTEEALIFVSGHATNVTTIGYLFGPNDLIVYDALSHNSIVQGTLLSGAKRLHFQHNDIRSLETILSRYRLKYERVLIVTEGLFSMDGDICPIQELIEIKKKYKAFLMIDEAHSIGVLGKKGRGIQEHAMIKSSDIDIWMGTLSKTLAGCGGYIAGSHALIEQLRYYAPGFIFSVGLSPTLAAASLTSLKIMLAESERVAKLQENSRLFLRLCIDKNLNTGNAVGYGIIPIIIGNSISVIKLANSLYEKGIQVQPIIYPAVTKSLARLRFFINSVHTPEQIEYAVDNLAEEIKKL